VSEKKDRFPAVKKLKSVNIFDKDMMSPFFLIHGVESYHIACVVRSQRSYISQNRSRILRTNIWWRYDTNTSTSMTLQRMSYKTPFTVR